MTDYIEKRGLKPLYTGIPIEVLRRIGETYREGFYKYDNQDPWEQYYKSLSPEDFLEMFNNAIEHLFNAYDEINNGELHDGNEDHFAHAVVNLCMIMWATENGKLPNKLQVNMSIENPTTSRPDVIFEDDDAGSVEEIPAKEEDSMKTKILKAFNLKVNN